MGAYFLYTYTHEANFPAHDSDYENDDDDDDDVDANDISDDDDDDDDQLPFHRGSSSDPSRALRRWKMSFDKKLKRFFCRRQRLENPNRTSN